MPSLPTSRDVHINKPLTSFMLQFKQNAADFVAGKVFPEVNVKHQSDSYYKWDKEDFHRDDAAEVAPGAEAPIAAARLSSDSYNCKVYKWAKLIADEERANQDAPLNLDRTASELAAQKLLLKRETLWTSKFFTTGQWGLDVTGVNSGPTGDQFLQFDDASSIPIEVITKYMYQMKRSTGFMPNKLVLGADVYRILKDHQAFLDRIQHVERGIVTREIMSSVLSVETQNPLEVLVPMSIKNSAKEGAAADNDFIHGRGMLLVYAPPAPSLETPSAGYTMNWSGLFGSQAKGGRIKRFRREERSSDQIQGEMAFDQRITAAELGYYFDTAIDAAA